MGRTFAVSSHREWVDVAVAREDSPLIATVLVLLAALPEGTGRELRRRYNPTPSQAEDIVGRALIARSRPTRYSQN
jgi:hypothetical protein